MHQNTPILVNFLGEGHRPLPRPFPDGKGTPLYTHPSPPPSLLDPPFVSQNSSQIYATVGTERRHSPPDDLESRGGGGAG